MALPLPTRKVGTDDVSAIGYGAASIAGAYNYQVESDEERFKILDRILELGCNVWDSASVYWDGEEILGKWFKRTGNRDKIFLATKGGLVLSAVPQPRGDPEFIREQVEQSLKRLQTDRIDLYYLHRIDPAVPIETTIGVLAEYVKAGKIRYLGLSEASVNTMRRAHAVHPITAIQIEYSPLEVSQEGPGGVMETARELGMAIFAFSPTGRGMTTGRFKSHAEIRDNDHRKHIPRFSEANFPRINALVASLSEIGKAHNNATAAQITLAWLLAQGKDIIPIPGNRTIQYAEENIAAARIELSEEEVRKIRELVTDLQGDVGKDPRMIPHHLTMSYVDTPLPSK